MKMIRAIVRPEKIEAISSALSKDGYNALTTWDVTGRGKQKGILMGSQSYEELAKVQIMIVAEDKAVDKIVAIIQEAGSAGLPGDGKVFVTPVEAAYTLRTGKAEL